MLKLVNAHFKKMYRIKSIESSPVRSRLIQLGFHEDSVIILKRKAPIFGDPMLFEIGESQIALTKSEASMVNIEEMHSEKLPGAIHE